MTDLQTLVMKAVTEEIAANNQLSLADFQFRIERGGAVVVNLKSGAVRFIALDHKEPSVRPVPIEKLSS